MNETRSWPPIQEAGVKKPSIRLSLVGKATLNRKPTQINPATAEIWLHETHDTYFASGLFSEVRSGTERPDLSAEVDVLEAWSGSKFLWWLTGFPMGVIPSSATDAFTWKTTFKDAGGNVLGVIEKKESEGRWKRGIVLSKNAS